MQVNYLTSPTGSEVSRYLRIIISDHFKGIKILNKQKFCLQEIKRDFDNKIIIYVYVFVYIYIYMYDIYYYNMTVCDSDMIKNISIYQ